MLDAEEHIVRVDAVEPERLEEEPLRRGRRREAQGLEAEGVGGGVIAFENGVVDLREGTTSTANVSLGPGLYGGHGVAASFRSVARVRETVSISGNQGAGVYLESGGAVDLRNAPVITGNSLYGLACVGAEASFSGVTANITGNAPGDIAPSCTGF
jgi:hypothetical protein